jgi:hypothetical protein
MDKSESSLPTSENVSVVAAMVVARATVAARVEGPTEGTEVLSGAAWGITMKEEEERAPSSSEELWGSLTVMLTEHLDDVSGKQRKRDLLCPKRVSEVITISVIQPPVADVFPGNLRCL